LSGKRVYQALSRLLP